MAEKIKNLIEEEIELGNIANEFMINARNIVDDFVVEFPLISKKKENKEDD